jgi:putative membrane protein
MKKAAQSGQLEIEASKLAATKASHSVVKSFAAQMVKDHTAVDTELKKLASDKGVELPGSPPNDDQKKLEALGALSGATFDRQYAEEVGVKAHNEAVTLFRNASKSARDADIKAFAAKTLPALEHHLEMARKMAAQVPK